MMNRNEDKWNKCILALILEILRANLTSRSFQITIATFYCYKYVEYLTNKVFNYVLKLNTSTWATQLSHVVRQKEAVLQMPITSGSFFAASSTTLQTSSLLHSSCYIGKFRYPPGHTEESFHVANQEGYIRSGRSFPFSQDILTKEEHLLWVVLMNCWSPSTQRSASCSKHSLAFNARCVKSLNAF